MSRDTILDDAIARAKESEDWQLAEWLRMARGAESAARWYTDKLRDAHRVERKLLSENAKLRKLVLMMLLVCKSKGIVGGVFARPYSNRNSMDERVNFESRARELGIVQEDR